MINILGEHYFLCLFTKLFPLSTFLEMEVFHQTILVFLPLNIYQQIIIQDAWVTLHLNGTAFP